jgi:hypothetical protein
VELELELVAEKPTEAVDQDHIERRRPGGRRVDHALELRHLCTTNEVPCGRLINALRGSIVDGNGIGLAAAHFQSFSNACFPFTAQSARARSP